MNFGVIKMIIWIVLYQVYFKKVISSVFQMNILFMGLDIYGYR